MKSKLLHFLIVIIIATTIIGFSPIIYQVWAERIINFIKVTAFGMFALHIIFTFEREEKVFECIMLFVNTFFAILSIFHSWHTFNNFTPISEAFVDLMFNMGAIMLVLIQHNLRLKTQLLNLKTNDK